MGNTCDSQVEAASLAFSSRSNILTIRGEGATRMKLKLKVRVNRPDARTIRHALEQLSAKGSVRKAGDEFDRDTALTPRGC